LALLTALEFLTVFRLPLGGRRPADAEQIARSQGLFPLVGLLLGLMLVGLDRGLSEVMPLPATAALLVVALVVATGGLHLDGLADTCDGLFGGSSPPERLAIMRDSRVGTFGVLALVCVLLLRWAAFLSLASPVRRGALLLAPALGRCAMVGAVAALPYARPEGLGKAMHRAAWPFATFIAAAIALAAALLLFPTWGAALFAFASLVGGLIALHARSRLGGLTGDVYGAISECAEVAVLLAMVAGQETGHLDAWLWRG
jgi:adenosylcobinamide-GDP ribazoletransferase